MFNVHCTPKPSAFNKYQCRGLTRATSILCILWDWCVSVGNRTGTSCTAGEHSMQRFIGTALLNTLRNLRLYYYSSPSSCNVASSLRLGIVAGFDSKVDILDNRHVEEVWIAGERARHTDLYLSERDQGTRNSEGCMRMTSRRGHHFIGASPGPLTSSAPNHPLQAGPEKPLRSREQGGISMQSMCTL